VTHENNKSSADGELNLCEQSALDV